MTDFQGVDMHKPTLPERFWSKVEVRASGCWLWTGPIAAEGYGWYNRDAISGPAHRFSYEQTVGPIPGGLQLDHLCRVRHCVNPEHLEPVTQRVNVLRGESPSAIAARKTVCLNGHDLNDPANVYHNIPSRPGTRTCRPCAIARARAQRAKAKASR
jgi:hypothetical protein